MNSFGAPYRDCKRHKHTVDHIFQCFQDCKRGDMIEWENRWNVPHETLAGWYKQWSKDNEWRPYNYECHGIKHRIFTKDEEKAISDFILTEYIQQGFLFTNFEFRRIAVDAFLMKYQDIEDIPEFNCSDGFIQAFKKLNRFSSRRSHYKRRPVFTEKQEQHWNEEIKHIFETVPRDRILNCDETSWRIYPNGILTWAEKGSNSVQTQIQGDEKECITVLATISSSGTKLPLLLIAKGKTNRCEQSQLDNVVFHHATHSENGWMTEHTFSQYLFLIREYMGNSEVHLILDIYSAHRTNQMKQIAAANNIHLHFIPAGMTDIYQPLE